MKESTIRAKKYLKKAGKTFCDGLLLKFHEREKARCSGLVPPPAKPEFQNLFQ